jgi:hypothetical protein
MRIGPMVWELDDVEVGRHLRRRLGRRGRGRGGRHFRFFGGLAPGENGGRADDGAVHQELAAVDPLGDVRSVKILEQR